MMKGKKKKVYIPINPRISNTVGELFLLSPENRSRKVWLPVRCTVKGLTDDVLNSDESGYDA